MPTLHVDLDDRSYPIEIKAGILNDAGFLLSEIRGQQVIIITNETIAPLYLAKVESALERAGKEHHSIIIKDGEAFKTLATFDLIVSKMLEIPAARDACVLALGGGVIGDLSGFVAACYLRGIDFVQVPTTLLSQVDSSVGGKTAVNHPLGKNMLGAFYQPKAVYIDTTTLSTLAPREFSAGMAEVIKYGIIYDRSFYDWLEDNKTLIAQKRSDILETMIEHCCRIKAEIVRQDEKEQGIRALLNLGHTFGHAIEAQQGYGSWLHGEAVAAGMVLALKLSNMRNDVSLTQVSQVCELLSFFDLPIQGPEDMQSTQYIEHMKRDKKVMQGKMRFILPVGIGEAKVVSDVSVEELQDLLD